MKSIGLRFFLSFVFSVDLFHHLLAKEIVNDQEFLEIVEKSNTVIIGKYLQSKKIKYLARRQSIIEYKFNVYLVSSKKINYEKSVVFYSHDETLHDQENVDKSGFYLLLLQRMNNQLWLPMTKKSFFLVLQQNEKEFLIYDGLKKIRLDLSIFNKLLVATFKSEIKEIPIYLDPIEPASSLSQVMTQRIQSKTRTISSISQQQNSKNDILSFIPISVFFLLFLGLGSIFFEWD